MTILKDPQGGSCAIALLPRRRSSSTEPDTLREYTCTLLPENSRKGGGGGGGGMGLIDSLEKYQHCLIKIVQTDIYTHLGSASNGSGRGLAGMGGNGGGGGGRIGLFGPPLSCLGNDVRNAR